MPHVELPSAEFKVVLLGDTNTGKTCLVLRLVEGSYKPLARSSTVGAFFLTKRLTVNNITCKMLLWDTAGQEQFQKLAVTYYQHAAAAIVCYDASNPHSVVRLRRSLQELDKYIKQNHTPMVLAVAACKCDLQTSSSSSTASSGGGGSGAIPPPGLEAEARRIAKSYDALYFPYTSAKMNQGVTEVFTKTAARVLEWHELAVTGQARPLPVTVGSQRGPSANRISPSKRRLSGTAAASPTPAKSSGYRSPSARTSQAQEYNNNSYVDATRPTPAAAASATRVSSTPLAAQLSNANGSVPIMLGVGGVGGHVRSLSGGAGGGGAPSLDAILHGEAIMKVNHPNRHPQYENGSTVKKVSSTGAPHAAVAADQDSSTTANESDDATAENYEPPDHHHKQQKFPQDHDHDTDNLNMKNINNNGPKLHCDGTYLVCGVDDNDKSCIIS
jgi:small GTP-binding protein